MEQWSLSTIMGHRNHRRVALSSVHCSMQDGVSVQLLLLFHRYLHPNPTPYLQLSSIPYPYHGTWKYYPSYIIVSFFPRFLQYTIERDGQRTNDDYTAADEKNNEERQMDGHGRGECRENSSLNAPIIDITPMLTLVPALATIVERNDDNDNDDLERGLSQVSKSEVSWECRKLNYMDHAHWLEQQKQQRHKQQQQQQQQNQQQKQQQQQQDQQEQLQDLVRWTQNQQPVVSALPVIVEGNDDDGKASLSGGSECSEMQKIIIQQGQERGQGRGRGQGQGQLRQQQEQREQQLGEKNWQLQHAIQAELANQRSNISPNSRNVEHAYYRK